MGDAEFPDGFLSLPVLEPAPQPECGKDNSEGEGEQGKRERKATRGVSGLLPLGKEVPLLNEKGEGRREGGFYPLEG